MLIFLSHVDEQRRRIVLVLNNALGRREVVLDDAVEERHGRAHACHLILVVVLRFVVSRVRRTVRVLKRVDQRVQGEPDWDQLLRVVGDQDDFLFAEQVREDLDDGCSWHFVEQTVEKAIADVR